MATIYAELLDAAMKAAGETQYSLSIRSNVPQPTIQRILSGETADPRVSTMVKLASALGCDVSTLMTRLNQDCTRDPGSAAYKSSLSPKEEAALGYFRGLTEAQKDAKIRELAADKSKNDEVIKDLVTRRKRRERNEAK
jgi:transcriptional regulator with XRE-family HTH domain